MTDRNNSLTQALNQEACSCENTWCGIGKFTVDQNGCIIENQSDVVAGYQSNEVTGKHTSIFYLDRGQHTCTSEEYLSLAYQKGVHFSTGIRVSKSGSPFLAKMSFAQLENKIGQPCYQSYYSRYNVSIDV